MGFLARAVLPTAGKFAGKALRFLTKGKLLGAGGGRAMAGRLAGAAGAIATGVTLTRPAIDIVNSMRNRYQTADPNYESRPAGGWPRAARADRWENQGGRAFARARRMNPMNVRALRRSVRRINSAEKLFRQVFTIVKGQVNVRKTRRSR